jgi:hypothetical protein
MSRIEVPLTRSATTTHEPLAALGYALRRAGLLAPLNEVSLPIKTLLHQPGVKLIEAHRHFVHRSNFGRKRGLNIEAHEEQD